MANGSLLDHSSAYCAVSYDLPRESYRITPIKVGTPTQQTPVNVLANVEVQPIDHLGLLAAAIESLRLVQRIDERLPMKKDSETKVTHGQCVRAMIINAMGYVNAPLYMTPKFYQDKDTERLIGPSAEGSPKHY
jgi:hypothetical protein